MTKRGFYAYVLCELEYPLHDYDSVPEKYSIRKLDSYAYRKKV